MYKEYAVCLQYILNILLCESSHDVVEVVNFNFAVIGIDGELQFTDINHSLNQWASDGKDASRVVVRGHENFLLRGHFIDQVMLKCSRCFMWK